jgi:hypothetical protein
VSQARPGRSPRPGRRRGGGWPGSAGASSRASESKKCSASDPRPPSLAGSDSLARRRPGPAGPGNRDRDQCRRGGTPRLSQTRRPARIASRLRLPAWPEWPLSSLVTPAVPSPTSRRRPARPSESHAGGPTGLSSPQARSQPVHESTPVTYLRLIGSGSLAGWCQVTRTTRKSLRLS